MTTIEREVIKSIADIAKISPEHGNALMDVLGESRYCSIIKASYSDIIAEMVLSGATDEELEAAIKESANAIKKEEKKIYGRIC